MSQIFTKRAIHVTHKTLFRKFVSMTTLFGGIGVGGYFLYNNCDNPKFCKFLSRNGLPDHYNIYDKDNINKQTKNSNKVKEPLENKETCDT